MAFVRGSSDPGGKMAGLGLACGVGAALAILLVLAGPWHGPAPAGAQTFQLGATETAYIATSAHSTGAAGSVWRTDLEIHNPGTVQAAYGITLLKHAENNSAAQPVSYTLDPGKAVRYPDLIDAVFHFSGKGALRVACTAGKILITSRTYNAQPSGSYGQFVPAFRDADAILATEHGRLIQLSHQPNLAAGGSRTNLGVVNATAASLAIAFDHWDASGAMIGGTQVETLKPYEYKQYDKVFERVISTVVNDAYIIIRTTTANGRFFAYASVIDNRTSDPVFIPAQKLTGSVPVTTPTRTPTVKPTSPPGGTAGQVEIGNEVATALGKVGGAYPNVVDLVNTAKLNGIDALFTQIATLNPNIYSKTATGLLANYGAGYTEQTGTRASGSMTLTKSSFAVNGNRVTGAFVLTPSNLKKDGVAVPFGKVTLNSDFTVAGGSTATGDVTFTAADPANASLVVATGNMHFDSTQCAKYPISGSTTVTINGKTSTFTVNQKCDGSFSFTLPDGKYYGFELFRAKNCAGQTEGSAWRLSLVGEGGKLAPDPGCSYPQQHGPGRFRASGTVTPTSVNLSFSSMVVGFSSVSGTVVGRAKSSIGGLVFYTGTLTYTYKQFNFDGSVKCSATYTLTEADEAAGWWFFRQSPLHYLW